MQVLSTHPSDHRGTNALKRALADIGAPNWCVAYGDRIEMFEAANRERYKGKKVIHIGGGETTFLDPRCSHPDHSTRWALSVIADVHFVANEWARENLDALGIWRRVYVTGCPSLDEIVALSKTPAPKRDGSVFEWFPEHNISKEWKPLFTARYCRLSESEFLQRLRTCGLFRTNSSAGLREAPILGTPVEMVGDRQAGRAPAGTYHDKDGLACYNIRKVILEHCHE